MKVHLVNTFNALTTKSKAVAVQDRSYFDSYRFRELAAEANVSDTLSDSIQLIAEDELDYVVLRLTAAGWRQFLEYIENLGIHLATCEDLCDTLHLSSEE